MAGEMRDDAGLQPVFDGSGADLEATAQRRGHRLNPTSNRVGNVEELAAGPDAAYGHPEHSKSEADRGGAYVGVPTTAAGGRLTRRLWWMIGAVVLLLLVIIAVLGGLLGSRSRSAPAASAVPTASSPNASSINSNTGMTAISWQDTQNVHQNRLYYQSATNEIRESAWNNTQNSWYTLNDRIGLAKNGSPLVAAVKADYVGTTINLFFLDESGQVNEMFCTDGANWQSGSLNTHKIFPASFSKLAATWSQNTARGDGPQSLLLVYQDEHNHFQLYNSTEDSWGSSRIPAHPIAASGVSLSTMGVNNYPSQLRLYYQIASGNLVVADWVSVAQFDNAKKSNSTQVSGKSSGWNLNEARLLGQFAMEAPITSFSYRASGSWVPVYGNVTGLPNLVDVLMSGSEGVTAVEWMNGPHAYQKAHKPPQMNAVQNYSSLASNTGGSLYALQDGSIREFKIWDRDYSQWIAQGQSVAP